MSFAGVLFATQKSGRLASRLGNEYPGRKVTNPGRSEQERWMGEAGVSRDRDEHTTSGQGRLIDRILPRDSLNAVGELT